MLGVRPELSTRLGPGEKPENQGQDESPWLGNPHMDLMSKSPGSEDKTDRSRQRFPEVSAVTQAGLVLATEGTPDLAAPKPQQGAP